MMIECVFCVRKNDDDYWYYKLNKLKVMKYKDNNYIDSVQLWFLCHFCCYWIIICSMKFMCDDNSILPYRIWDQCRCVWICIYGTMLLMQFLCSLDINGQIHSEHPFSIENAFLDWITRSAPESDRLISITDNSMQWHALSAAAC